MNYGIISFFKTVDQSLLKSGLTVPKEACDLLQASLGISLNKGDRSEVTIRIDDNRFQAQIVNVNFAETTTDRTVIQIRYAAQSESCVYLNNKVKI